MKFSIYQIDLEKDEKAIAFESLERLENLTGKTDIDSNIYNRVFKGETTDHDLEDIYQRFNISPPMEHNGRALSVSDIVVVNESDDIKPGAYYCDNIGFKEVSFDEGPCEILKPKIISVVMCEPGKKAYITEIGTQLSDLQKAVGGDIEAYYPFEAEECIVCCDEGKINGSSPCRAVYNNENGEMMDIIFGKFFICDCSGENFASLGKEQKEKYLALFDKPERFFRTDGEIKAVKYDPPKADKER